MSKVEDDQSHKSEVSQLGPEGVCEGLDDEELDSEGRLLAKEFKDFVLVSCYTPHSGVGGLKRLEYRVDRWDRAFESHL